jgi:predicted ATPase
LASAALVTIVGPGGVGKTRLAAEVARRAAAAGEPVRVVELAGVRSPDAVPGTIAAVLHGGEPTRTRPSAMDGPQRTDGADPVRRVARDLVGLVVLDNCEHVLDAVAESVGQILAVAPRATVLATSRAPLGLVGEVVYRLRALADDDALALLESRARAGGASLSWSREQGLSLCHRLDNLPLALELAAARLRHTSIDEMLAALDDRFGLLDEALRGLPERHASLWAMVDWSHDLLPPEVRRLWWRLSVIPAPFTVDTAIGAAGTLPRVRAGLATLVDQSLLTLDRGDDGAPRYRMLETVREYGEVRLAAKPAGPESTIVNGMAAGEPGGLPNAENLAWTLLLIGGNVTVAGIGMTRTVAVCRRALRRLFAERGTDLSPRIAALAWLPTSVDIADLEKSRPMAERLVGHDDPLVQGFGLFLSAVARASVGDDERALADLGLGVVS